MTRRLPITALHRLPSCVPPISAERQIKLLNDERKASRLHGRYSPAFINRRQGCSLLDLLKTPGCYRFDRSGTKLPSPARQRHPTPVSPQWLQPLATDWYNSADEWPLHFEENRQSALYSFSKDFIPSYTSQSVTTGTDGCKIWLQRSQTRI